QDKRKTSQEIFDSDQVFARDALRIAIETEKRGVDFYRTACETVSRPSTKNTFKKMLSDERSHLAKLKREWDRLISKDKNLLEAPVFLHFDFEALERIFPSRREARKKLRGNLSEKDALELAMTMEKEAFNFFKAYAEKFNDTRGRDIFVKFAAEEQEHYDAIKRAHDELATDS
ncbi:MAG: ferritin family protein, partial [Acidobacteriota bacterium]